MRETFEKSELGRMKQFLPLHEMTESFGLVRKSMTPKHPLTNYKLLDDIAAELSGNLKIQELQNLLAERLMERQLAEAA